eukprot:IDg9792t1
MHFFVHRQNGATADARISPRAVCFHAAEQGHGKLESLAGDNPRYARPSHACRERVRRRVPVHRSYQTAHSASRFNGHAPPRAHPS